MFHHAKIYRKNYHHYPSRILRNASKPYLVFLYKLKGIKDEENVKNVSIIVRDY